MSEPLIPNMPEVPLPAGVDPNNVRSVISASNVILNPDETDPDGITGLLSRLQNIKPEEPDVAQEQRPEQGSGERESILGRAGLRFPQLLDYRQSEPLLHPLDGQDHDEERDAGQSAER